MQGQYQGQIIGILFTAKGTNSHTRHTIVVEHGIYFNIVVIDGTRLDIRLLFFSLLLRRMPFKTKFLSVDLRVFYFCRRQLILTLCFICQICKYATIPLQFYQNTYCNNLEMNHTYYLNIRSRNSNLYYYSSFVISQDGLVFSCSF